MRKQKFLVTAFFLFSLSTSAVSQDTLTLDKAADIALTNNQSIRVAMNRSAKSKNNAHPGQAGMLPSVSINGGANYSNESQTLKFAGNIPDEEVDNAISTSTNASLDLNYTVFDGMHNIYQLKQLKKRAKGSQKQTEATIERTLIQVANAYYQVARAQESYRLAKRSVSLSQERLRRTEADYDYGNKSKVDVLNAQVDLDTDSTNMMETRVNYRKAKNNLNVVMGRQPGTDYVVAKEVTYRQDLALDELLADAMEAHPAIEANEYELEAARLERKMSTAAWFPEVALNGSYNYNKTINDAGIVRENQSNGFSGVVSISVPLYSGSRKSIQAQNARIDLTSRQQELEQKRQQIRRNLMNTYATYQKNLRQLNMEQRSVDNARLNYERSQEAYRLGQINTTQLREAQLNLIRAELRLSQTRYNAKLSELQLLQHSGKLKEQFQ